MRDFMFLLWGNSFPEKAITGFSSWAGVEYGVSNRRVKIWALLILLQSEVKDVFVTLAIKWSLVDLQGERLQNCNKDPSKTGSVGYWGTLGSW